MGIAAYSWSQLNPKGVNKLRSPRSRAQSRGRFQSDLDYPLEGTLKSSVEHEDGSDSPGDDALGDIELAHSPEPLSDNDLNFDNAAKKPSRVKRAKKLARKTKSVLTRKSKNDVLDEDDILGLKELDVEPRLMARVAAKRGMAAKFSELTKKPFQAALDITRNPTKIAQSEASKNRNDSFGPSSNSYADTRSSNSHHQQVSEGGNGSSKNTITIPAPDEPLEKPDGANTKGGIVTDLVARINIKQPLEQQELMTLLREHDYKFHRSIHLYGLNQLTDIWCDIEHEQPSSQFVDLGLSIQLADRNGAMSSKEAHDFQQMVLEFTTRYDAPFEFSMDVDAALNQAQKLDAIGLAYDSMAVLNIVAKSREGFRVADVESCARDLVMLPDAQGVFMKTTGQRNDLSVMYRLACSDGDGNHGLKQVSGGHVFDLVLIMNVPATGSPEQVFQEMIDDANKLAVWLEGKVVDRSGRPLAQKSLNTLLRQVSQISSGLRALGVTPGDAVSKKLF